MRLFDLDWSSYFRVNSRMVENLRRGRVFVMGDAAHIHSPALAQGMNTGIQDAWNLGWKLALVQKSLAHPTLLDSFEAERMPVERRVLGMTDFTQSMITAENPVNRFLRDTVLPLLSGFGAFQSTVAQTVGETAIDYRHSRIVENHRLSSRTTCRRSSALRDDCSAFKRRRGKYNFPIRTRAYLVGARWTANRRGAGVQRVRCTV
jgi:hypothetical protein